MLQSNWPLSRDSRQLGIVKDQLPIERYRQAVTRHDDMEGIPLTYQPVRLDFWCHPGMDLRRKSWIGTIPPYLARTDWPAPDVHLRLVLTSKKDPRIGIRDLDQHLPAGIVLLASSIRENYLGNSVDVGTLLNPPVHQQLKVGVASGGPQVSIAKSLVWMTVDDSLDNLPILVLRVPHHPAIQVDSVEKRYEPFRHNLVRLHSGSWLRARYLDLLATRSGPQNNEDRQE